MSAPVSGGTAVIHRITHASVTLEGKTAARLEDMTCWLQSPGGLGTGDRFHKTAARTPAIASRPGTHAAAGSPCDHNATHAIASPLTGGGMPSPYRPWPRKVLRRASSRRGASELPEASRSLAPDDETLGRRPFHQPGAGGVACLRCRRSRRTTVSSSCPIEQTPTSRCICSSTPTTGALDPGGCPFACESGCARPRERRAAGARPLHKPETPARRYYLGRSASTCAPARRSATTATHSCCTGNCRSCSGAVDHPAGGDRAGWDDRLGDTDGVESAHFRQRS